MACLQQPASTDGGDLWDPPQQPEPLPSSVQQVLWAACATCRGSCCRLGAASHAFQTGDSLRAYRLQYRPDASDAEILAAYRAHLPERSLTGGCVYQAETGCALPREMRSGICNRYLCDGLLALKEQIEQAPADRPIQGAYLLHSRFSTSLYGGRVVLPILPPQAAAASTGDPPSP